jgi:DNA-binding NarL/FixJ family response regulator
VLLVDDHIMVRQGLRAVLNAYPDIELVGEAGNGAEAIQLADQLHPAVVLMDINMPKMNGIEATKDIMIHHPEMIIIALSVNAAENDHEATRRAGAVQLITKEAAVEQLYDAIQKAIKRKKTMA